MDLDRDQRIREKQRAYFNFIDDGDDEGVYLDKVKSMINKNNIRLIVNVNDLRKKIPERAKSLIESAFEEVIAFQNAIRDLVVSIDGDFAKKIEDFYVGFEGSFGSRHVTPRTLTSQYLSNMVCVEGIITKCSLVRPKIVRSVHYCPATQKTVERRYADMTSLDAFPTSSVYPTKDDDGNPLETEYGLSAYKDHQTLTIQEMPEKAPAGQLPRSVDIVVDDDLVDKCKPGDRVQIIGNYRVLPGKKGGFTNGTFRSILMANNIELVSKEQQPTYSATDVSRIRRFSKKKNVFDILSYSLAPSIYGHEYIKKAILCMLLGGLEKVLDNGTRLRGDINILLIGDPSVAKSQLLRYVLHTAPRAIPTTGRGSSGVGLTAAVTSDFETGERRLEAGAMVLADRGVVCIDEFDKMSDIDRTAIHEVMEQGRVTIAKAGIHAKLNARCSVLAAANPVYGKYDPYKTPMENINLQDSLLSRFDCIFIMLDKIDAEQDKIIADHVCRMHEFRARGEADGAILIQDTGADLLTTRDLEQEDINNDDEGTPVYEKYDATLHGNKRTQKVVSLKFMKKYIQVAKAVKPMLTSPAAECMAEEYSRLRSEDSQQQNLARTQPVTVRALETLIRLATAHAKARISTTIDEEDAQAAIDLVQFAYFKKVEKRRWKKNDDLEGDDEEDENEDTGKKRKRRTKKDKKGEGEKRKKLQPGDPGFDEYEFDSESDDGESGMEAATDVQSTPATQPSLGTTPASVADSIEPEAVDDGKLKEFTSLLHREFQSRPGVSSLSLKLVLKQLTASPSTFTSSQVMGALKQMQDTNKIYVAEDFVFLI